MHIICEGFTCPKDGASEAQNDDAHFPLDFIEIESAPQFRCAVADGATESIFAGKWAAHLAKAFCHGRFTGNRSEILLRMIQSGWTSFLKSRSLPWYAAAKAEEGSFATLMGLELHAKSHTLDGKARWMATALGDSCLFLIRNNSIDVAIPLATPDEFNNRPYLLASNPKFNFHFADWLVTKEGDLRIGDTFYLMTDALSLWFLLEHKAGNRPWEFLRDVGTDAMPPFSKWIRKLRAIDDRMNDDATLLRVEVQSVE